MINSKKRFYKTMKKILSLMLLMSLGVTAAPVKLDSVAVIVDQGVVLESEVVELVTDVKKNALRSGQSLPSDRALRLQAIERLILESLQMQMAERMGLQISDAHLEQTISNIAQQQGMSAEQLRLEVEKEGLRYELYREKIRKEVILGEVRRNSVRRRVYVTPQEIENLVKLMDERGKTQAEYNLGHILVGFPPDATEEDNQATKERADKVLDLLNKGSDFKKVAIAASSGARALDGGELGWMNVDEMPTLFAEAVQGKGKDQLIGPIRSGAGFHILKIMDVRGLEVVEVKEVNSRHILVKPSVILSEKKAEEMLQDFREKILSGDADFAELAKQHSEDPGSGLRGGNLGWADPEMYVPAFKDKLAALEKDQISEPFRSVHGWHIVQLIDRRTEDATEKRKRDRAYQLLFNRKFNEESESWLKEIRDQAYIEVLEEQS
jgi:peptidyl-prolyl cis-trans isomerase SurA